MTTGRHTGKSMFTAAALKRLMDDLYNQPLLDLILSENRINGSKFYCVQPQGGNWMQMEKWVREVFGEPGEAWPAENFTWPEEMRWCMNNRKFWFRNEADRTMFILKWR